MTAQRKVDIRIFDRSYTPSKEEVERKLTKAALTERGYSKTTTLTQTDDGDSRKIVRYQKNVPCQDITKVEEELRRSIPSAWGRDVSFQVRKEALKKRDKGQRCTAGIEIHFPSNVCRQKKKVNKRGISRCKEKDQCFFCFINSTIQ